MAPLTTTPPPGSMTVPPLFGWGDILILLLLLVAVAVAFFVTTAVGTEAGGRAEWQAWLDARSSSRQAPAPDPGDRPAEPACPVSGGRLATAAPACAVRLTCRCAQD
jgi:hypothetical protein